MMNTDIFRLAAVLYADNNYEVKPKTIHRKIIESLFIDNNNEILTIYKLIDEIKNKYNFIFDEDEVYEIVTMNSNFAISVHKTEILNINLTESRHSSLKSKVQNNNIDYFICEFHKTLSDLSIDSLKRIIYEFLYEIFKSNITSFEKLIDPKIPIGEVVNINDLNFSQLEIEIINSFLNWENDEKNHAIFNISNAALEYCLISNKKGNNFKLENLKNKKFYLDSNVIFRAIGINGEVRKNRVLTFLNKFKDADEELLISKFTYDELRSTIAYYAGTLNRKNSQKINSKVFIKYSTNSDFLEYYHNWRKKRVNDSIDLFQAYIHSEIENLKNNFKIKFDHNIPFDIKDKKINELITDKASSINSFKQIEKNSSNYIEGAFTDAKNIYLIENKRDGNSINIFDCKYYLISSDQYLRKWDYQNKNSIPIVLLPSQWMCILLRYLNRTSDDFKSFVSFLNISSSEKLITNENLQFVLDGISEITNDFDLQSEIIEEMINKKFEGVIEKSSTEDQIISNSRKYAKTKLEKDIENIQKENKNLETKFENYYNNTTKAITDLQKKRDIEKSNKELLEKENKEIKRKLLEEKLKTDFAKYQYYGYFYILLAAFCLLFLTLNFFFKEYEWNYINIIRNYSNTLPEGSMEKEIVKYIYLLPLGLFGFSANEINKRFINKNRKEEKKKSIIEKYNLDM